VAEAIRLYGRRFWASLALGIAPGAVGIALTRLPGWWDTIFVLTVGGAALSLSYVGATLVVAELPAERRSVLVALAVGVLVFAPFPFLASALLIPGLAWLALFGLAVPVAVVERQSPRGSLRRALELARADYVHALGGLSALVITALLTATVLFFLLRGQGDAALSVAAFLAVLVISPVVFLGSALLYFDQEARARLRARPPGRAPVRSSSR
jgi:hypothetical protein